MKVRQPLKMFIIVVGDCVSIGFVIFIAKTKLLQWECWKNTWHQGHQAYRYWMASRAQHNQATRFVPCGSNIARSKSVCLCLLDCSKLTRTPSKMFAFPYGMSNSTESFKRLDDKVVERHLRLNHSRKQGAHVPRWPSTRVSQTGMSPVTRSTQFLVGISPPQISWSQLHTMHSNASQGPNNKHCRRLYTWFIWLGQYTEHY